MPIDVPIDQQRPEDDEARMRRRLGLGGPLHSGPAASVPGDPLKGARQAIRSQALAREYAERQLAHAEATIQDLRAKLHRARHEKDAAVETATAATARMASAQRALIATEAEIAAQKAAQERIDRALRDARATIQDLQAKVDAATESLARVTAELAAERQTRRTAVDAPRGSMDAREQSHAAAAPEQSSAGAPAGAIAGQVAAEGHLPVAKRPVGTPGKNPGGSPAASATEQQVARTAAGARRSADRQSVADQEPVQWWVPGWKARSTT